MNLEHVNGATGERTEAMALVIGIAADTGAPVYRVYAMAIDHDPARGDWFDLDGLDPDVVLVVPSSFVVRQAVRDTA